MLTVQPPARCKIYASSQPPAALSCTALPSCNGGVQSVANADGRTSHPFQPPFLPLSRLLLLHATPHPQRRRTSSHLRRKQSHRPTPASARTTTSAAATGRRSASATKTLAS
eukprot:362740-Chlamydomonas_euryale.AAC.4